MKHPLTFINRNTGEIQEEAIYGEKILRFFYGKSGLGRLISRIVTRIPQFSQFYGYLQRQPWSKRKILPFIEKYSINKNEFLDTPQTFKSFNDFFTRKLKPEARPIVPGETIAVIPADGRFLFYPQIDACDGFVVKGKKFTLERLLGDSTLASRYEKGSLVLGRLCPTDYHRFHFPCDCIPGYPRYIQGSLFSVNPLAIRQNIEIFCENKRMITELKSPLFGTIQFIEVGATAVGSIHQTFQPECLYKKGDEKGFFSFGGSSLVLLFEPNKIEFDEDILRASSNHMEILCQMGQSMGKLCASTRK